MLRVSEHWHGSDVGRQRSGNEDALFVRAPLFVLADGMGGAQAGEVASALVVDSFGSAGMPAGTEEPERWLSLRIGQANASILEAARTEPRFGGMGTTCTAAYIAPEAVILAHVGDSRCYMLRDGELRKLTRDHSLIGELIDRGKLTPEEALNHPQRSVITRAVGIEQDLIVDTERLPGRAGDLFLLCSDGLTDMVPDERISELLRAGEGRDLAATGRALVAAANEAGGRDNITVILFRLEDVGPPTPLPESDPSVTAEQAAAAEEPTGEHEVAAPPEEPADVTRPQAVAAAAAPAAGSPVTPVPPRPAAAKAPRKGRRYVPWIVSALIFFALVGSGAFIAVRAVFFLGTNSTGSVVIYRGLPFEGPFGIKFYTLDYTSGVTLQMVPASRRKAFTNQQLRSLEDAVDLVERLEMGEVKG